MNKLLKKFGWFHKDEIIEILNKFITELSEKSPDIKSPAAILRIKDNNERWLWHERSVWDAQATILREMVYEFQNKKYFHKKDIIFIFLKEIKKLKSRAPYPKLKGDAYIEDLPKTEAMWWHHQRKMWNAQSEMLENICYVMGIDYTLRSKIGQKLLREI